MRFLKWFKGSSDEATMQLPPVANPPPMPDIVARVPYISEPVVSLIKSIEDGEWEFDTNSCVLTSLKFKRELQLRYIFVDKSCPRCFSEWMTWEERKAVNNAIESYLYRTEKMQLAKERESFMCFVKGESNGNS